MLWLYLRALKVYESLAFGVSLTFDLTKLYDTNIYYYIKEAFNYIKACMLAGFIKEEAHT